MSMAAFSAIERLLREHGIPEPEGRGQEKLDAIREIIREYKMTDDLRQRLRNLLALCSSRRG